MPKHILIPVALDHEGLVPRKIKVARTLLEPGGKITLLTVLERVPGFVAELVTMKPENHLVARIEARLQEVAGGAEDVEIAVEIGKPGVQIAAYATDHDVDLVVIGSKSPGPQEYFLGSTADRVARRARCSVFILR